MKGVVKFEELEKVLSILKIIEVFEEEEVKFFNGYVKINGDIVYIGFRGVIVGGEWRKL